MGSQAVQAAGKEVKISVAVFLGHVHGYVGEGKIAEGVVDAAQGQCRVLVSEEADIPVAGVEEAVDGVFAVGLKIYLEESVAVDVGALEIVEVEAALVVAPAGALPVVHGALAVYVQLKGRGKVVFVVDDDFRHLFGVEAVHLV